jgi:hypothetical protein
MRSAPDRAYSRGVALPSRGESSGTTAIYTIRAQGRLASNWSIRAEGSRTFSCGTRQFPVAAVCGRLGSQAALLSVLEDLYELGLPLLSLTVDHGGCSDSAPRSEA